MKKSMFVLAVSAFAMLSESAIAQVTYTYTGNPYTQFTCGGQTLCGTPNPQNTGTSYTATDHVTVSLTVNSPLGPNFSGLVSFLPGFSMTMSDGEQTLTSAASSTVTAFVTTDSSGNINEWILELILGNAAQSEIVSEGPANSSDGGLLVSVGANLDGALNSGSPGTWTNGATPAALTMNLITTVQAMQIPQQGASLIIQLQAVASDIGSNNGLACADLNAFVNHVSAQTGMKITPPQATIIQTAVSAIKTGLGCK